MSIGKLNENTFLHKLFCFGVASRSPSGLSSMSKCICDTDSVIDHCDLFFRTV